MPAKIELVAMPSRIQQLAPRPLLQRIAPVWVAILLIGSLLPGTAKDAIGTSRLINRQEIRATTDTKEWKHRTVHIVGFGATTLLFLCLATGVGEEILAATGVFALGLFIEYAQMWLFNNRLEVDDIRDDAYGIVAMYAFVLGWGWVERACAGRLAEHR